MLKLLYGSAVLNLLIPCEADGDSAAPCVNLKRTSCRHLKSTPIPQMRLMLFGKISDGDPDLGEDAGRMGIICRFF